MDLLLPVLAGTAVVLLVGTAWAATVAFVCWDVRRGTLPVSQQLKWAALSLLPFVGFVLYLVKRKDLADASMPSGREAMPTSHRNPVGSGPAIAAVEFVRTVSQEEQAPSPAADPATLCLSVTRGPHQGEDFGLGSLPATIGRGTEATIQLARDPGVSRRHAELYEREGRLWLRDLGSRHGTLVNDRPIADQELVLGDVIEISLSLLRIRKHNDR